MKLALPLVSLACDAYTEHNELENKFYLSQLKEFEAEKCEKWQAGHEEHLLELATMKKVPFLSSPICPLPSLFPITFIYFILLYFILSYFAVLSLDRLLRRIIPFPPNL